MRKCLAFQIACLVLVSMISVQVFAEQSTGTQLSPKQIRPGASLTPANLGRSENSDMAARLEVVLPKVIVGGNAVVGLTGIICNKGMSDYVGTEPLDVYFMIYTWHPPRTAAQEQNMQIFGHTPVGPKLMKGECKNVSQTYTIPQVVSFGSTPNGAGQRRAARQFVVQIKKSASGVAPFSKSEDSDASNNAAESEIINYIEGIPSK